MFELDERKLLKETAELAHENNRILRKLLRHQRWIQLSSLLRWAIMIGLVLGAYYYIQPFFEQLTGVYQQMFDIQLPTLPDLSNYNLPWR